MNKKNLSWVIVILVVVLPIAWYILSPIWRVVEVDEVSPLDQGGGASLSAATAGAPAGMMIKDTMNTMDAARLAEFKAQTDAMKGDVMVKTEVMPSTPQIIAQAPFQPRAHDVKGRAVLIESSGKKLLRFEDFETVNGPDLRIYLSTDLGTDDFVDLGPIRATKGNVNYELDASIDTSKYRNVLVWCQDFSILFSYASLQ
jgi:hypothetical protein